MFSICELAVITGQSHVRISTRGPWRPGQETQMASLSSVWIPNILLMCAGVAGEDLTFDIISLTANRENFITEIVIRY